MSSPINSLVSSAHAPATESRGSSKLEAKGSAPTRTTASDDSSEVGEAARLAMDSPEFDAAKVESIRRAIAEGRYPIDPKRIAESFMALEKMLGPTSEPDNVGGR